MIFLDMFDRILGIQISLKLYRLVFLLKSPNKKEDIKKYTMKTTHNFWQLYYEPFSILYTLIFIYKIVIISKKSKTKKVS